MYEKYESNLEAKIVKIFSSNQRIAIESCIKISLAVIVQKEIGRALHFQMYIWSNI